MRRLFWSIVTLICLCLSLVAFSACDSDSSAVASNTQETGLDTEQLSAPSFNIDGTTLSLVVPNSTDTYSFLGQIKVDESLSWQISTDVEGTNLIPTKTATLLPGDNAFYILVSSENGEELSLYTVTIRRRPIYTVSFQTDGGTPIASVSVEEGNTIPVPQTDPVRDAYSFDRWEYDFSLPVTDDITIKALWIAESYSISYNPNGGENADNPTSYCITDNLALKEPTWELGRFLGWYTPDGDRIEVLNEHTGDLVLTARWECYFTHDNETITGVTEYFKQTVTEIKISGSLDGSALTIIGDGAFRGCTGLVSVTIGNDITNIGQEAFLGCSGLTSVAIGNKVSSIGYQAFSGCTGLTSITVPSRITDVKERAFAGCSNLVSVLWNATNCATAGSVTYPIFAGCTSLQTVTIGNNVEIVPACAFYGCTKLTSITIPYSVKTIGNFAFQLCVGMTSIVIPDNVTSIGSWAFGSSKASIVIGKGVVSIGNDAFNDCSGEIRYTGTVAQWNSISKGNNLSQFSRHTVHCVDGDVIIPGGNY